MPLFVLLSGFTFSLAYLKNGEVDNKKLKKQIANVVLLYLIFQVALCSLKIVFSAFVDNKMNLISMMENILFPNNIMWYLWLLVFYYIAFGCLLKKIKVLPVRLWAVMFIFLAVINLAEKITAPYMSYRLCVGNLAHCAMYFWLGIGLCKIKNIEKIIWNNVVFASAITYSASYVLLLVFVSEYIVSEGVVPVILGEINAVMFSIVLIRLCNVLQNNLLSRFGKNCLVVYLLHTYFVTAMKVGITRLGLCNDRYAILVLFLTWLVPTAIVFTCAEIINRFTFTRKLFKPILFFEK